MNKAREAIDVRAEVPADYDAIHAVVTAAFGRDNEARLVRLLRDDPDAYIPELALVATAANELVGHVMLTKAMLHGEEDWQVLALGPLAVTPEQQRTGIGIALTEAALERAGAREEPLVVLLGHPGYYPRFGFEPARRHGIEPPSPLMSDEAFMMRKLSSYDETYRGQVRYPPAFDVA